jgi:ATP-dependent Lon protease
MVSEKKRIYHLYRRVLFPHCSITVTTYPGGAAGMKKGDIVLVRAIRFAVDIILPWKKIATMAEVTDIVASENTETIVFKGISRVTISRMKGFKYGEYRVIEEGRCLNTEHYVDSLRKKSQELIFLINIEESDRLIYLLSYLSDLNQLADFIANYFVIHFRRRYALLLEEDLCKRAEALLVILDVLINKIKKKIQETNEKTGS